MRILQTFSRPSQCQCAYKLSRYSQSQYCVCDSLVVNPGPGFSCTKVGAELMSYNNTNQQKDFNFSKT